MKLIFLATVELLILGILLVFTLGGCTSGPPKFASVPSDAPTWDLNVPEAK